MQKCGIAVHDTRSKPINGYLDSLGSFSPVNGVYFGWVWCVRKRSNRCDPSRCFPLWNHHMSVLGSFSAHDKTISRLEIGNTLCFKIFAGFVSSKLKKTPGKRTRKVTPPSEKAKITTRCLELLHSSFWVFEKNGAHEFFKSFIRPHLRLKDSKLTENNPTNCGSASRKLSWTKMNNIKIWIFQ